MGGKIKILILIFLSATIQLKAQYTSFEEQKALLVYKLLDYLVFPNDDIKIKYNIALYGCSENQIKAFKKNKPSKIFTDKSVNLLNFNPDGNLMSYDIVFIGESKLDEVPEIYNKYSNLAKQGYPIVIMTNQWNNKEDVTINFIVDNSGQFIKFQYSKENLNKFNISVDARIEQFAPAIDINLNQILQNTKQQLEEAKKDLHRKVAELQNTITELNKQKAKIDSQKVLMQQQQKLIELKQKELVEQQQKLNNIQSQLQVVFNKLQAQQEEFAQKEIEIKEKEQAVVEYANKLSEMQANYNKQKKIIDKKNAEIDSVSKQIEIRKKELGNLNNIIRLQRYALIVFAFLMAIIVLMSFWIFRNYKKMKTQNVLLETQKNEIIAQAEELEKANVELEKLSLVASETNNAVSIIDKNDNFEWVNAGFTKLYGYTLQLLENELDKSIRKCPLYEGIDEKIDEVYKNKRPVIFEHSAENRNKEKIWIQSSISPIFDYQGNLKRLIIVDGDITAIKEAEHKIEEQNKNIKKSIQYARRIQNATLPSTKEFMQMFPENFILYLPREIVSGDFYWIKRVGNKKFFSVADCTGHGVPGAFMSMLGITLLNEIVSPNYEIDLKPDIVLNEMKRKLVIALRQGDKDTVSSDGIALSLCMIEDGKNILNFAGAENGIIVISKGKLTSYQADEMNISLNVKEGDFTNNEIPISQGDYIYQFSDGYVDQFGGPGKRRKKFLIARLRELLLEIYQKPADEQREILLEKHLEWKGNYRQIDDILIMGVRV